MSWFSVDRGEVHNQVNLIRWKLTTNKRIPDIRLYKENFFISNQILAKPKSDRIKFSDIDNNYFVR